jgi:hypothetical protein
MNRLTFVRRLTVTQFKTIPSSTLCTTIFNQRSFGTFNVSETTTKLPDIKSSNLSILRTIQPKLHPKKETLKFGATTTDHMLEIDWTHDHGWNAPRIIPYQPLLLDPAASSLHYALQGFEGMKAYVDSNKNIRMFRPDMNMKRLNSTARRLFLPEFDSNEFLKCIEELIKLDRSWIPEGEGYSLYIRPTIISTHPFLGVQPALRAKLYVICSPVGPYFPGGFAPVKLYADPHYARAWPGGQTSQLTFYIISRYLSYSIVFLIAFFTVVVGCVRLFRYWILIVSIIHFLMNHPTLFIYFPSV